MKFYLTLFFITLYGAAQSIKCKRCWVNDYNECCHEKEIDCPGSKCMTISEYCIVRAGDYIVFCQQPVGEQFSCVQSLVHMLGSANSSRRPFDANEDDKVLIAGVVFDSMQKTCATEELCGTCLSSSNNQGFQMRVSFQCGEGDYSNADLNFKKICEDPLPLNGYKCPSCFYTNTTAGCQPDGEVKCGGNQYSCFKYGGILQLSNGMVAPVSAQGCVTENGCRLGWKYVPGTREFSRIEYTCVKAIKI